jgi:hypothetical protein
MSDTALSYSDLLLRGPFPGVIDPWSEIPRYFQQCHANMIGLLQRDLQRKLFGKNYLVSRESSLQIMGEREPDLFVRRDLVELPFQSPAYNTMNIAEYTAVAEELSAEVGIEVDDDSDLHALYIRNMDTETLVTVLEIISPGNKDRWAARYRQYRTFLLEEGVNFVELDLTRSVQRLLENRITRQYHYYIGIYLPGEPPLVIGSDFNQPLKRFALPLLNEAIAIETQSFYNEVYQDAAIARHIVHEKRYTDKWLPFASTLSDAQRSQALQQVEEWLKHLSELRPISEG